jgi:hypothetical protein
MDNRPNALTVDGLGVFGMLVVIGWSDGPIVGVVREVETNLCWFFKLVAERTGSEDLDDRLFGFWQIGAEDSSVLIEEFDDLLDSERILPPVGGINSPEAELVVRRLQATEFPAPDALVRTFDFVSASGVWYPGVAARRLSPRG